MPDYTTPGVYIEEQVATGPIVGVGTSTAAFLGVAGKGPIAQPTRITNLTRFTAEFVPDGPLDPANANLVRGVRGFFENGGTTAWVTRVGPTGGTDETPGDNADAWSAALAALAKIDEISLVCAPGVTDVNVQQELIRHCEIVTQDRFAILDAEAGATVEEVLAQRANLSSTRGYSALYHPWLTIPHPDQRGETLPIPPSGHVAGVFARVDAQRGVHKAPANEQIGGVVGLHQPIDDTDHGALNVKGVNVLRVFPGRSRPMVWGARTTSDDTAWWYVNVRRLFLFVEESIQEGIRWAVFEPNDLALWKRLDRTITEFLTRVWSSGALFGATAAEAFYVKIDKENNPEPELGQVFIEVGIAPVRPAEFIVVRIGIWAGGGQVQEG